MTYKVLGQAHRHNPLAISLVDTGTASNCARFRSSLIKWCHEPKRWRALIASPWTFSEANALDCLYGMIQNNQFNATDYLNFKHGHTDYSERIWIALATRDRALNWVFVYHAGRYLV